MVEYTLLWSKQSRADLQEIFRYIKNAESSERAKHVIAEIKKTANEIILFPAKHAIEPVIIDGTVRYVVKWNYKVLFTISEKHINIVRIFHSAQNPDKLNQ